MVAWPRAANFDELFSHACGAWVPNFVFVEGTVVTVMAAGRFFRFGGRPGEIFAFAVVGVFASKFEVGSVCENGG